jgi:sodium transport system permease protein
MLSLANMVAVFRKEFRELLRDRRSLMVMFGVPVVVYPLLFMGVGSLARSKADEQKQRVAHVVVRNGADAPELLRRLGLPLNRIDLSVREATDADLASGKVDAVLVVPAEAESRLLRGLPALPTTRGGDGGKEEGEEGTAATTESAKGESAGGASTRPAGPAFLIRLDRSRSDSDGVAGRLRGILGDYEHWVLQQRLAARGVSDDVLAPVKTTTVDIASQEQRLGRFLGQLLPMLLMITGMLGAFFPALNATTTERELGTLETLLVTPVSRVELLIAKGALVFACGLLTAGLNMVSMSLVFANIASSAGEGLGHVAISPSAIFISYLAVIPTLALFSAIVMCVGLIARTYREANSFAMPVMMMPMAAMAVGIADPATTPALLATPIINTSILLRDILTNRSSLQDFLLASGVNLMLALGVICIAARLFTNEQLVNPSWEPVSLKSFRRGRSGPRRFRLPTIDEALFLIAATLLVQFYGGPWLGKLWLADKINAPELIVALQVGSFILPTAILAYLASYRVLEVFSVRVPQAAFVAAALLLGMGLAPLVMGYGQLQQHLFPSEVSDSARNVAKLIGASLDISPIVAVLFFGVVPGICEEIVFRGVVLSAMRRTFNVHVSVWLTGLLFALVHMDAAGLVPRTVLGALLGYITVYSGSLLPAMLLHAAFNGTTVGIVAFYEPTPATTRALLPNTLPEGLRPGSIIYNARLLIGLLAATLGTALAKHASSKSQGTP